MTTVDIHSPKSSIKQTPLWVSAVSFGSFSGTVHEDIVEYLDLEKGD